MNILAVDTSTKDLEIAIKTNGKVYHKKSCESLQHSKILFSELEEIMATAGIEKEEIDIIATNVGVGSFTGIRIGVVFAKGMANTLGTKLVSVESFEAIAEVEKANLPLGIICEERNGGGYFAVARNISGNVEITQKGFYRKEEIESIIQVEKLERIVSNSPNKIGAKVVSGIDGMLSLSEEKAGRGEFTDLNALEPVYIKKSQAEEQMDEKEAREKLARESR